MLLLVLMKDRRTSEDASIRLFVILSTSASGLHLSSSLGPVSPCLRVGRPHATAPPRQRGPVPVVGVLSLPPGDCPPCVYREYLLSTDVQDMNLHLFILLCTIDSCMHLLSPPLFTLASLNLPCYKINEAVLTEHSRGCWVLVNTPAAFDAWQTVVKPGSSTAPLL